MNKMIGVVCIGLGLLTIAGCASKKHGAGTPVTDGNAAATASGMGESGAYAQGMGASPSGFNGSNCSLPAHKPGHTEQAYFFDYDRSDVSSQEMGSIQRLAQYFSSHPGMQVHIYGNTDDRGSREYNIALGQRRANAVASLLKQYGVTNPVAVVSYGAEKPVAFGTTEQDYQCNRRVDVVYKGE